MAYDFSTFNASDFGSFLTTVSSFSGGWLARMILITLFAIIGVGYYRTRPDDITGAFAVSSWIVFVIATVGWLMGLVDNWAIGIAIASTLVASLLLFLDRQ